MQDLSELGNWIRSLLVTLDSQSDVWRMRALVEKPALFLIIGLAVVAILMISRKQPQAPARKSQVTTSTSKRAFGEWTPQPFRYPSFDASPYAPSEIKPPMYRPFRWGEYNVTMGIRSMHWEEWIELDDQFETYYQIRKHRLESKAGELLKVLPPSVRVHEGEGDAVHIDGGSAGAIELVHELAEYLSRRYPTAFQVKRHSSSPTVKHYPPGWDGLPPIKSIHISAIEEELELPVPLPIVPLENGQHDIVQQGLDAMRIAALLVQDDLAIMVEGSNGGYYFQAGAILVGGFWRIKDKIGKRLDEVHISGDVPQYAEKLHVSLERFFRRLSVDKPVVRNNYFVQIAPPRSELTSTIDPDELAWGAYVLGPEENYGGIKSSSDPAPVPPVVTPQTLRMRTERQTLRRLPRSGAIVFTIRTYLVPVEELAREPGVAARFASAVRSWTEDVREYKGEKRYGDVLLRYLDGMAAKEPATTDFKANPYPF